MNYVNFLALLFIATGSLANYQDGNFLQGDTYNDIIYQTNAYSVNRLPYGITYFDLVHDFNTNVIWSVLDHTVCPNGNQCQGTQSMLANFGISPSYAVEVSSLQPFNRSFYGRPMTPDLFKARSVQGYTYVLTDGRSVGKLLKLSTTVRGSVVSTWPAGSYIANGVIDDVNAVAYLLDYGNVVIHKVNLTTMQLIKDIPISFAYQASATTMRVELDRVTGRLFVVCLSQGNGTMPRWSVTSLTSSGTMLPFVDYLSALNINTTYQVAFVKADRNGSLYIGIQSPGDSTYAPLIQIQYIKIWSPASTNWRVSTIPSMPTRPFTDHFFDDGLLYTTNAGGQLTRISTWPFAVTGVMTIVSQHIDVHDYTPGVMPGLMSAVLYEPGVTAYIGTDWWGQLIKVNLQEFCPDTDPCSTFSPWEAAIVEGWKIALSVVFPVVGVAFVIVVLIIVIRRRRARRGFLLHERQHLQHSDYQAVTTVQPAFGYSTQAVGYTPQGATYSAQAQGGVGYSQYQSTTTSVSGNKDGVIYGTL
eukprot:TRINITY_DN5649_c0_g1_i1.p1 TRINITY_DN5649_c0_g1~~TRINITY_DN5649_c0_g1_i1.p1  ORF type:complete len:545 (-),score=92.08 TRINITY_DN5649_c0_g1_i1:335-1921(-)